MKYMIIAAIIAIGASALWFGANSDSIATTATDNNVTAVQTKEGAVEIPTFLHASFPNTTWENADPKLTSALSGGPAKDGIPAIDDPAFVPLSAFDRPDAVRAIVLTRNNETRVYPYNILVWHEIVNDTIAGQPLAITFCPLCGSAIVYDRTLPDGTVSTFGVSGGLIESNMIMYDRATEGLWQQSTGAALAGEFVGAELTMVPFDLMTLGEVRENHPNARVLSEDTGYRRDYGRTPYSGYTENDRFIFQPSNVDTTFDPKEIMVVYRVGDALGATPWQALRDAGVATGTVAGQSVTLRVTDGDLTITSESTEEVPNYFEMWFSVAVQNDEVTVITP